MEFIILFIVIPTSIISKLLTSWPTFCDVSLFNFSHSSECVVVSHYGFNLHFSNDQWCWTLFHVFINHFYIFLCEVAVQIFWPFFKNLFIWLCQVSVATWWDLCCSLWDLVPWPGIEPRHLHWEHGVLTAGPPGKSLFCPL